MKLLEKLFTGGGFLLLFFLMSQCGEQGLVYEKNIELKDGKWFWADTLQYQFEIQDTTQHYDFYYSITNGIAYPFQNLYVTFYLEDAQGKVISKLLQNITLMNAKTGEPFGEANFNNDIFTNTPVALKSFKFKQAGVYTFKLQQYMRVDTLPHLHSFGIKVIKSPKKP